MQVWTNAARRDIPLTNREKNDAMASIIPLYSLSITGQYTLMSLAATPASRSSKRTRRLLRSISPDGVRTSAVSLRPYKHPVSSPMLHLLISSPRLAACPYITVIGRHRRSYLGFLCFPEVYSDESPRSPSSGFEEGREKSEKPKPSQRSICSFQMSLHGVPLSPSLCEELNARV